MSAMNLVAWIGRYSPALANRIRRWYVSYLVPFNRVAGIRVAEVDAERARSEVTMESVVVDSQRKEIARLSATYVVLRPGTGHG